MAKLSAVKTVARLLRVPQWVKSGFVFAPLIFSERLADPGAVWDAAVVAGALSMFSSSIYIMNDLMDAPRDRKHPAKRHRPIASGEVSALAAATIAGALVLAGYGLLWAVSAAPPVWWLATGFLALNVAYTFYLKHKVIADVLTIAIGYVLRVLAGAAAIQVEVSDWLLICTFLLAIFLGFSKRRHELAELGEGSTAHRHVLHLYSEEFLDRMSMLTLSITVTCYILYTRSPDTIARFGTHGLVYSSLIVLFAMFRYLFLIHVKRLGSPTEMFYADRQIVMAVVAWVLYIVVVIYTWPALFGSRP